MPLNEKIFVSLLKKLNCFEQNPHIAVGVSGGPDSMALTYLLSEWTKLNNGKLFALIFNHNIRPNSSEESYQVKNMLKNFNIKASIIKPNKNKLIKKNMADARSNRFEGLINFCKKNNILHLFLGHHFDDNLETYLIRKINGSNLEGLGSINKISYYDNIQIIRPFIQINKASILKFNKMKKINFINDPSNRDIKFTRIKVRNLLDTKNYKQEVKIDFLDIKKQIPKYKQMLWELLINSLIDVKSNKIQIRLNKLVGLNNLVVESIVLLILKFFSNKKSQTKSAKIKIFIELVNKPNFKIFNLSGIIIEKRSDFLIFSNK